MSTQVDALKKVIGMLLEIVEEQAQTIDILSQEDVLSNDELFEDLERTLKELKKINSTIPKK